MSEKDIKSLEHTRYRCQYHIVFAPKYAAADVMGYLKGKSSLMIFDRHANLKYKIGRRTFWARGYYVDTVGRNKKAIQEYIRRQLEEDMLADQMSIKECYDPFTGEKTEAKKKQPVRARLRAARNRKAIKQPLPGAARKNTAAAKPSGPFRGC